MRYFKKEDFDKCMEFLADKPETQQELYNFITVEAQQKLYNFIHEECHMMYILNDVTVKNMSVYSKVYATRTTPKTASWCRTMSDGSQVIWNRKYQEFYIIDEVGMERCGYLNYSDLFVEIKDIDPWLLENWSDWSFREMQKQLVAIFNGKFNQYYMDLWRRSHD